MSINKYNPTTDSLEAISQGRVWIGTKEKYEAAKQAGTLPLNAIIMVTNDEDDTIATEVIEDDSRAVSGGAVYSYVDTMITQALTGTY